MNERMKKREESLTLNKSGLATLSEYHSKSCQELFALLEAQQSEFIDKFGPFRSPDYKWPNDPLHCWSRIWEYPYVYSQINQYMNASKICDQPLVADLGSGVTFFPFSLARLGCNVVCVDIDPVCEIDLSRAREIMPASLGAVGFRLVEGERLPFVDDECDIVYSISVLEHIPDFENTILEISRVLKPGGLCVITCDLDLSLAGKAQLNLQQFHRLEKVVLSKFEYVYADRTVHPIDVLTSRTSPASAGKASFFEFIWRSLVQKIIKPLLGRDPGEVNPYLEPNLAVMSFVLRRLE